ncbi:hypothetical protein [Treponema sp.]|uniref:hypothetical protein n=1 Tax=Treponema sp. TaxID=166 RepID=UPI00388EF30E
MDRQWFDEKEQVKTSFPLLLTLGLVKVLPLPVVSVIIFPVAFFYYLFSKRARTEIRRFQNQMRTFTGGHLPRKLSTYRTLFSFSLCLVERIAGWIGKIDEEDIFYNDDDIDDYWENLENGQGCLMLASHLGNVDLLRSLSTFSRAGVDKVVPVTVIMEIKSSEKFNKVLKSINPDYELTALDPTDITPETIISLQEKIKNGEIVVLTGDRISAHSTNRFIKTRFLGKEANFPYGVFLIAALLECPTYFCFGLRDEAVMLRPVNAVYMHRSDIDFTDCKRSERDERIKRLCENYVMMLEKYCMWFPNQWYNFFDFWSEAE